MVKQKVSSKSFVQIITALAFLIFGILGFEEIVNVVRRGISPFSVFLLFYLLFFGLRPAILLFNVDPFRYSFLLTENELSSALNLSLVYSSIYLVIVYLLVKSKYNLGFRISVTGRSTGLSISRVIVILMVLTYFLIFNGIIKSGGITRFVLNMRQGTYQNAEYISGIAQTLTFLCIYFAMVNRSLGKRVFVSILLLIFSFIAVMMIGDRSAVISPLVLWLFLNVNERLSLGKIFRLSAFFYVSLKFTKFVSVTRSFLLTEGASVESLSMQSNGLSGLSRMLSLDNFDNFVLLNSSYRAISLRFGQDFLNGGIGIIPRSLWLNKPDISTAVLFAKEYFGLENIGRPITSLGDWVWNFGLFGVIVGAFISGIILGLLNSNYNSTTSTLEKFLTMHFTLLIFGTGLHATSFLIYIKLFLPLVLILKVVKNRDILS